MAGRGQGRYSPEYKERIVDRVRAGRTVWGRWHASSSRLSRRFRTGSSQRPGQGLAKRRADDGSAPGEEGAEAGSQAAAEGAGPPKKPRPSS